MRFGFAWTCVGAILFLSSSTHAAPNQIIVSNSSDSVTNPAINTLRWAILNVNNPEVTDNEIVFMGVSSITLDGPLPPILAQGGGSFSLSINPGGSEVTINGNNTYPAFVIDFGSNSVSIQNLTLQDMKSIGGNGGLGGGGGGLGAGAGILVISGGASISNVTFNNNNAVGGDGGAGNSLAGGGGGGGFAGNVAMPAQAKGGDAIGAGGGGGGGFYGFGGAGGDMTNNLGGGGGGGLFGDGGTGSQGGGGGGSTYAAGSLSSSGQGPYSGGNGAQGGGGGAG